MSRRCDVCHRGPTRKISRSHSHIATVKRQYVNLQNKTLLGKRVKICTNCLKTTKKES